MKTDDLIKAMVADNKTRSLPISGSVALAVGAGVTLAALLFFYLLHVRSDFTDAIVHDPRFLFKFVFTIGLGIPALLLVRRLARPEGSAGLLLGALAIPAVLLIAAVGLEMSAVPAEHWSVSALGTMPGACLKYIPMLSLAPLAAVFIALRQGAPSHPVAAGAAAGLLAASIGATLYASFCVDDSPMFVAIWYVSGMGLVTALGAMLGARLLRW